MKKRFLTVALIMALMLIFASCDDINKDESSSGAQSETVSQTEIGSHDGMSSTDASSQTNVSSEDDQPSPYDENGKLISLYDIRQNNEKYDETDSLSSYLKYWTQDGVKEMLRYSVNSDLWYHGEYSKLYPLIGREFTVMNLQVMQQSTTIWENISLLFENGISFPSDVIIIEQMGPTGYPEPFICEDIVTLHCENENDLLDHINSLREHYYSVFRTPEYRFTIQEPTAPKYENENSEDYDDEVEKIIEKLKIILTEKDLVEDCVVYIKDFLSFDEECSDGFLAYEVFTDVFVDSKEGVYKTKYNAIYEQNLKEYSEIGDFIGFDKIESDADMYYYDRVRSTTLLCYCDFEIFADDEENLYAVNDVEHGDTVLSLMSNGTYYVSGLTESAGEKLVIPSEYHGTPVTGIDGFAVSERESIKEIYIPESITYISDWAFNDCPNVKKVVIDSSNPRYKSVGNCIIDTYWKTVVSIFNNGVIPSDGTVTKIGYGAFYGSCGSGDIDEVDIPKEIRMIGNPAYSGWMKIKKINYSGTVDDWKSIHIFYDEYDVYSECTLVQPIGIWTTVHCTDGDLYLRDIIPVIDIPITDR